MARLDLFLSRSRLFQGIESMVDIGSRRLNLGRRFSFNAGRISYYIDRYEVTVERYERCVRDGGCSQDHFLTADDVGSCNYGNGQRSEHPMNCVSWYGMEEYCTWVGKRLPTEAEWEKAARGTDGRTYPWGEARPTCSYAVMDDGGDGCGKGSTWPVGSKSKGVGPYGSHDLSGNVWEWCEDWYDEAYYSLSPRENPVNREKGKYRVLRGGSWYYDNPRNLRGDNPSLDVPWRRRKYCGGRCVRSL